MTIAAIDIGTNTVLLLIAHVAGDGTIEPVLDLHRYPRLGKGVDANGTLRMDSIDRAVDVLQEYRDVVDAHRVDRIVIAGTSAVRDAANRDMLKEQILRETGFTLEVLSGEDEAYWTFRGALSGFPEDGRMTVIDIGGGSTEVTTGDHRIIDSTLSLDIGSVRMTERFLHSNPPAGQELTDLRSFLHHQFAQIIPSPSPGSRLIGVAGTATSLAILDQGTGSFRPEAVQGYELQRGRIEDLCSTLSSLTSSGIRSLSAVMQGREDIITAGAVILLTFLQQFGFESVTVSERGIRHGLVLRERDLLTAR